MIEVFLSRPTWIPESFRAGLDALLIRLGESGIVARTLGVNEVAGPKPLDDVIRLVESCYGMVVLGVPQIEVTDGLIKGERIRDPVYLPSEWNHIEAALGHARAMPLLIVSHVGISRGVFDPRTAIVLTEADLTNPAWPFAWNVSEALSVWQNLVMTRAGVSIQM